MEALANGVPVLCPDHFGFHDAVTPDSGIRFKADTSSHFVEGLVAGIHQLYYDESLRFRLALGALERSQAFSWDLKAQKVNDIYERKLLMTREKQS